MNHSFKSFYKFFVLGFILFFLVSCQGNKRPKTREERIKETINRAFSWVYGHPSNFFIDGGFIEIAEEIITFYIAYNHTKDTKPKQQYKRQIEKRLELIKSKKDFSVKPPEFTMLLTVASIAEKLELKEVDFKTIIEKQILTVPDPMLYPPHITTTIWNMLYLERLGYKPNRHLDELMPQSTLNKELNQRLLFNHLIGPVDLKFIDPVAFTIYDLTHEIFALTDFGMLPAPPVILDNQVFFSTLFTHAIDWSINIKHIDILAELIMSVKLLDLKDINSLESGIKLILSSQKSDGSFGITNPSRPNIFRHGILVSIMALFLFME